MIITGSLPLRFLVMDRIVCAIQVFAPYGINYDHIDPLYRENIAYPRGTNNYLQVVDYSLVQPSFSH